MTECDKIQEILPAYLEGLSSQPESEMVSSHLASCQVCGSTVKALMKSQKLIANLDEVEPPPWLKTRIMARLEEGVEQEKEEKWNLQRLKNLLLYPLKVKIPLQAFTVLLLAVAVFYVYRTIQPEVKLLGEAPQAVPAAPVQKEVSDQKREETKTQGRTAGSSEPQAPAKIGPEGGDSWPANVREIFRNTAPPQTSLPPGPQAPSEIKKDQDLEAKATKSVPPGISSTPRAAPAVEDRAHEGKTEMEKGKNLLAAKRQEGLALTVHVNDIKAGSTDVEAVLRDLNAPVARESREGSSVISTEVPAQRAREIIRRLNGIGQVQQKGQLSNDTAPDKTVSVRIQVLQKQP